jgi:hypothetical protein
VKLLFVCGFVCFDGWWMRADHRVILGTSMILSTVVTFLLRSDPTFELLLPTASLSFSLSLGRTPLLSSGKTRRRFFLTKRLSLRHVSQAARDDLVGRAC